MTKDKTQATKYSRKMKFYPHFYPLLMKTSPWVRANHLEGF